MCDGTNGTPDLRNRFIYGGDGTNEGSTGGNKTVTLTNDNLPQRTVVSLNKNVQAGSGKVCHGIHRLIRSMEPRVCLICISEVAT